MFRILNRVFEISELDIYGCEIISYLYNYAEIEVCIGRYITDEPLLMKSSRNLQIRPTTRMTPVQFDIDLIHIYLVFGTWL